jgi:hypothetical protein
MRSEFFDSDDSEVDDDDEELIDDWLDEGDEESASPAAVSMPVMRITKEEKHGQRRRRSIAALHSTTVANTLAYNSSFLKELRPTKLVQRLHLTVNGVGQKMVNDYVVHCELGHGAFGKVLLLTRDDMCFACKLIQKPKAAPSNLERMRHNSMLAKAGSPAKHPTEQPRPGTNLESSHTMADAMADARSVSMSQEVAIMMMTRHPHVLSMYEVIDDPKEAKTYMILEVNVCKCIMS